jgi:hypothetical protein
MCQFFRFGSSWVADKSRVFSSFLPEQAVNGYGADIVMIHALHATIGGSTPAARNIISAAINNYPNGPAPDVTGGYGIFTISAGDTLGQNVIEGNCIGTDITGRNSIGNALGGSRCDEGGDFVLGNVISANSSYGITGPTSGTVIQSNFIGTDVTGTKALGNGSYGRFTGGGTYGGPGVGNLVSGNNTGFFLAGDGSVIQGNFIGTDVTGIQSLSDFGNECGIFFYQASNTLIGGTDAGDRNIISGNYNAIIVHGASNVVEGNFIGTDSTGTVRVGNHTGVTVDGATNTIIGGITPVARNIIAGSDDYAVATSDGASNHLVEGNYIGTDWTGATAIANGKGVYIQTGNNNTVGGTAPGVGNTIAYNQSFGVDVDSGLC